ncbi:MAG: hypothetical protein K2X02_04500 [Alphaproteobacteria bacterium]|nr:hypothetical protein [Alphaproteobacteria bacterium]
MKLTLFILSLILMMGNISTVLAQSSPVKLEKVRGHHHFDDRADNYQKEHKEQEGVKMPGLGR